MVSGSVPLEMTSQTAVVEMTLLNALEAKSVSKKYGSVMATKIAQMAATKNTARRRMKFLPSLKFKQIVMNSDVVLESACAMPKFAMANLIVKIALMKADVVVKFSYKF